MDPIELRLAQTGPVDPERVKVERADENAKAFAGEDLISDPTVFVKSAALSGLTEVALAKLVQSKSRDENLERFAARMIEDHGRIRAELAAVARRKHLDVPTALVYEDEQMLGQAAEKSGPELDAWCTRQMITEHQKAITLFRAAAKMDDPDLAAFARKTLPLLEEHHRMAIALLPP